MPKLAELEKLVKEYLAGDQARLADIKTVWMNTEPKPEGTWAKFCVVRLKKSRRQINRQIEGRTGHEARNVNGGSPGVPLLQTPEPSPPITEAASEVKKRRGRRPNSEYELDVNFEREHPNIEKFVKEVNQACKRLEPDELLYVWTRKLPQTLDWYRPEGVSKP